LNSVPLLDIFRARQKRRRNTALFVTRKRQTAVYEENLSLTSIKGSLLHFGQYRGKFLILYFSNFISGFVPTCGQNIHFVFSLFFFRFPHLNVHNINNTAKVKDIIVDFK
jgi:hypothetical protein